MIIKNEMFRKAQEEDFTVSLQNEIKTETEPYVLSILNVKRVNNEDKAILLGSGTLIKISENYCILTAGHVVCDKLFKNAENLGLVIGKDARRFDLSPELLDTKFNYENNKIGCGPDIGLIIIKDPKIIGWLKAKKMFWNIDINKKKFCKIVIRIKVCGLLQEVQVNYPNIKKVGTLVTILHIIYALNSGPRDL